MIQHLHGIYLAGMSRPGMTIAPMAALALLFAVGVLLVRSPRKTIGAMLGGALVLLLCLMVPAMILASYQAAKRHAAERGDVLDGPLSRSLARLEKLDDQLRARTGARAMRHSDRRVTIEHGNGGVIIQTSKIDPINSEQEADVLLSGSAESCAEESTQNQPDSHDPAASEGDAESVAASDSLASSSSTHSTRRIDDPFKPEVDQEWSTEADGIDTESTSLSEDTKSQVTVDETPPKNKPDWIYDTLSTAQESHRLTVRCGPCGSIEEIERHEDEALQEGALKYAEWYLHANGKRVNNFGDLLRLQMPLERLHECVAATYDEVHLSDVPDVDPMPVRYLLLEFDPDFRRQVIDVYWQQSMSVARSLQAGLGGIGVFSLLGVVLGAVKIDAVTQGQHRAKVIALAGLVATTALLTFSACGIYFVRG